MTFKFDFYPESLTFGTVLVRAKIVWQHEAVRLKPTIGVTVAKGSRYEGKIRISGKEMAEDQKSYRFFVGLKEGSFSLSDYKSLILGKEPVPLLVTLIPDVAMPIPTAGVPIPSISPAIADDVSIAIPDAAIGQITAEADPEVSPEASRARIRARVILPSLLKEKPEIERKYTSRCEFIPGVAGSVVPGGTMEGEWKEAHLITGEAPERENAVEVPVTVRADIEGIVLERQVSVMLKAFRKFVLNVSRGYLRPRVNAPESITARVFEVLNDGSHIPVDDAELSIRPVDDPGVTVHPLTGQGTLTAEVSLTGTPSRRSASLRIEATVGESSIEKQVPVELASDTLTLVLEAVGNARGPGLPARIPIVWDDQACKWASPPLSFRLFREGPERSPEPVDSIQIRDTRDWFVLSRSEKDPDGTGFRVEVTVNKEKYADMIPGQPDLPGFTAVEAVPGQKPPSLTLTTMMTAIAFSTSSGPFSEGRDTAAGALSASTMVPGGIPSEVLPESTATSLDIPCDLESPDIHWKVFQDNPVRLSGIGDLKKIFLESTPVPKGFEMGISMAIAFTDTASAKGMGLSFAGTRRPGTGTPEEDPAIYSHFSPDPAGCAESATRIRGVCEIRNETCGFTIHEKIPETPDPVRLALDISARGSWAGTKNERVEIDVQPLCTAVYLGRFPSREYPWNEPKNQVQVIRSDLGEASEWSKLPVSLRSLSGEGWQAPKVEWTFPEQNGAWDDRFSSVSGANSEYIGPGEQSWNDLGRPSLRPVRVRIGSGDEDEPVSDRYPEIFRTKIIPLDMTLCGPVGKVRYKVDVQPRGFPLAASELYLQDERVFEGISRSFILEVDLQKIPARRGGLS